MKSPDEVKPSNDDTEMEEKKAELPNVKEKGLSSVVEEENSEDDDEYDFIYDSHQRMKLEDIDFERIWHPGKVSQLYNDCLIPIFWQ